VVELTWAAYSQDLMALLTLFHAARRADRGDAKSICAHLAPERMSDDVPTGSFDGHEEDAA
jgi:hypothetical protein